MAKETTSKFKRIQQEAQAFLDEKEIVLTGGKQLTRLRHFVHFWVMVGTSFVRNRCPLRASALAYTTLLALIPMLAVGVSISTSLLKKEGEKPIAQLIDKLVDELAPQLGLMPSTDQEKASDARKEVAQKISYFIANVNSGALGLTGTLALIMVAVGLLSTIEATFNDIWGVTRGRNWFIRLIHYWTAISLGPLLVVFSFGLLVGSQFATTRKVLESMPILSSVVFNMAPFAILSVAFMLIYLLMPNTKVDWRAAAVGGLVGGMLWNLNSNFNVFFASRVVTASKIYGSLGIVPVFLIGLYFSWLIVLFGAQVAYAFQNRRVYLQEKQAETVNQRGREFIALRLVTCVGERFQSGQPAATAVEIADELGVPIRLIHQIGQTLLSGKLLVEVSGAEKAYAPVRPLEKITCHDILLAMRAGQGQELATHDGPARSLVRNEFEKIEEAEHRAASAVTVLALVNRAHVRLEIAPTTTESESGIKTAMKVFEVTELSNPPTATAAAEVAKTQEETEPISPAIVATTAPPAESSSDDNRGFPL